MSAKRDDDRLVVFKEALIDEDGQMVTCAMNRYGQELPDPVPVASPVPGLGEPSLADMVRRSIWSEELARRAREEGFDTPAEADDLDIPDDPLDPLTPWEEGFDRQLGGPPPVPETPPSATSTKDDGGRGAQPPKANEHNEPENPTAARLVEIAERTVPTR